MLDLEPVDATFQVKGGANRNEAGCVMSPSGDTGFNAGGSEKMDDVAILRGLKPGQYGVTYGVDVKRAVVAVKAVPIDTQDAMQVRRTNEKQLSIHLGAVFVKYPKLRPLTTSDCLVAIRKDRSGIPCLVIALQMPMARQTKKRSSSSSSTEA